jgi:hypothetical protein
MELVYRGMGQTMRQMQSPSLVEIMRVTATEGMEVYRSPTLLLSEQFLLRLKCSNSLLLTRQHPE